MSFSSNYVAESANDVSTIIEATFTGTGTLEVDFVNTSLNTISIQDRTLKVIVDGYNDISNTFSSMTKKNHLNIVDLSKMVKNTGQTQGLDGMAFSGCTNLREITLFPNCAEIESLAFENCSSLKKIYRIPHGIIYHLNYYPINQYYSNIQYSFFFCKKQYDDVKNHIEYMTFITLICLLLY